MHFDKQELQTRYLIRLKKAAEYLVQKEYRINEIAYMV